MKRFFSPPFDELAKLRTVLQPGEKAAIRFLNKYLPIDWEIYIQPHLNGLRPDLVLLNPKVGIAIYEIKDWNLNALDYYIKEEESPPELWASKDGKHFSLQRENPIEKIYRYKNEIFELYCPRIDNKAGYAVITAGVIFPYADEWMLRKLFKSSRAYRNMEKYGKYWPLIGRQTFERNDIRSILPASNYSRSKFMNENLAKDLKNWLIEPDYAATQRISLEKDLDPEQKKFVVGRNARTESGYRRIRGPAGSGKSLVLGARASQLISEGKKVLVVTFNITLLHYLMDIAVRYPHGNYNTREDIIWLNFHSLCKRICLDSGFGDEYSALWNGKINIEKNFYGTDFSENSLANDILTNQLPALVDEILTYHPNEYVKKFDAVLVDEGQDFLPHWWEILRKLRVNKGEMLLVADTTQDIYGTAKNWTDEKMIGAGFSGAFAELKISYRMPNLLIDYVCRFAEMHLPKNSIDLPQKTKDSFPCKLRWIQTIKEKAENVCEDAIRKLAPKADPVLLSITDITFLTNSQNSGKNVSEELERSGMKVIHTFSDNNQESRKLKLGFFMGDARVKATTLHSFKGWESRALVIYLGNIYDQKSMFLAYTGLTRLKKHLDSSFLTVVCAIKELESYGKSWPEFEKIV